MFPLSKCYTPEDQQELAAEWAVVDRHFAEASPQAEMRRWEYAMALRAYRRWRENRSGATLCYDIGGAGSPFRRMIGAPDGHVMVVDPQGEPGDWKDTLGNFMQGGTELGHVVFCLSVLEHIEDLPQFLYHLACLTAPGGLLFLTVDCCDLPAAADGFPVDNRHFSWLRQRIFNPTALTNQVYFPLATLGCSYLGSQDWTYHTDCPGTNWGYSCASLALQKRA